MGGEVKRWVERLRGNYTNSGSSNEGVRSGWIGPQRFLLQSMGRLHGACFTHLRPEYSASFQVVIQGSP